MFSSVATVIQVEFPSSLAEQSLVITSQELFARCAGNLTWYGADETLLAKNVNNATVTLDDNGNAFVVAVGGPSCASGTSTITADLFLAPYTTFTTHFTILSPRPTI